MRCCCRQQGRSSACTSTGLKDCSHRPAAGETSFGTAAWTCRWELMAGALPATPPATPPRCGHCSASLDLGCCALKARRLLNKCRLPNPAACRILFAAAGGPECLQHDQPCHQPRLLPPQKYSGWLREAVAPPACLCPLGGCGGARASRARGHAEQHHYSRPGRGHEGGGGECAGCLLHSAQGRLTEERLWQLQDAYHSLALNSRVLACTI